MFTYRVEIPEKGTFRVESPELLSDEQAYEAALTLAPPEQTVFGQVKESLKAIPRGAVGLLETGITGAAALLPEEYEKPVVAKAQELAKRFSPQVAPGYEDSPFVKIGEGLGSMITPIGIPGVVGKTLLLGAAGAGEARQRAQQAETTPEQISTATAEGIIPGLTDLLPLRYLMGAYGKVALNGMMSRATRMAATGGLEGAQEAAQNIMQNAIAQGYDPSQGLYEGTGESATYGGAVGAIAQGLIDAVLPGRARRGAQPPREPERIQSEEPPVTDSEIPLVQPGAAALKIPLVQPGAAPVAAPVAAPEKMSRWNEFLKTDPNKEALEARLEAVNQRLVWEEAQPKQNKFVINALKTQRDTKIPEALEQLKREVVPADILKPTLRKPKVKLDAAPTGPTEVKAERPRTGAEQFVLSDATEKPDVEETVDVGVGGAESTARGPAGGTEAQSGALEEAAAAQTAALAPVPVTAKPVKNQINKAKLEKAGEGERVPLSQTPLTSQQQKVADELVQVNKAPKAVQDYVKHYKGVDKAIPMVGFDTGYGNIKKGEMGYPQEGGAAARAFAKWIKVNGTSEQKNTLAKNQAEYARLKTKAEDKTLVAARETPQELRLASVKQTEDENAKDKFEADQTKLKTKKPKDVVKARNQIIEDRAGTPYIEPTDVEFDAPPRGLLPRSSRGPAAAPTGNTKEGVTKALKNYFKENSRFDALTTVVQSESELPEEVKRAEDYAPGVRGVAHRGKVWIVADNIEPGKELGVFLHEAGAHIGFDNILKPSDRQFLADQVRKWAKGNNDLVETRAAKVALEKGGKSNDEIIAYMVEELVNKNVKPTSFRPASTWLRRVLDAFKKAINKLDFRRDITPQELVDAANGAAHIAMKGSGTASYIAPRFSVSNPAMAAVSARTLKLVSGPPAPQNIVQRAYQTALHPEPKRFFQNLRQNFANKNTLWEDWFSSLHGNNALDTAGAASALDRLQASTKIGGIQLATLEKGGFRKGTNKLWEAYDTDASYQDIVEQVNQMVGKYDETPDFDSAQGMLNLAGTAKREEGLIASKQTTDTGGEIDRTLDDAQLREGLTIFNSTPEIQNALNLYKKFNDRNVDTLVTAGIIDAATAVELKGNAGYVPWFRFVEDADGNINFKAVKTSKGLINLSKMQNLEGVKIEDIQIGNILDNMAKLSNWMVNKSIGNDTAAFMIDFAIPYGQAKKVGGPSKNTVQIMRNGEDTYYELSDPAALAAFRGYEAAQGAIVSVLKSPANLLRKTITLNPVFSLTQLPQDSFRAFISGGLKNPYAIFPRVMSNFAKGFFSPSETAKELYKYGIRGISSGLPTEASENIRRKLGYYDKGAGGVWTQFVDGLERISAASDEAVRTALYELTLEEGGSQVMALRRAREIINFDTQGAGATSSFFRQTVPFMGVWMNDLNNLYKGLVLGSARLSEGEQAATRAAIVYRGMQVAALTVLYTLMVGDDDDYKKLNDDVRNRSLILPGTGVRIPIPNDGIGFLFKVIPEEVTRMVMAEGIESDDAGAKMGRALWNGFTNVGSFENIIPVVGSPLAKTFVELTLNKSFYTGNPVVGKSKENLEPENQYTESTSEIAKQLGAALNISPIKLDYLVRGLTAQVGGSVLAVSNSLFHAASGKVTPSWSGDIKDIPLLGAFGYSRKDKSDLEDYYELRHVVDKVSRTYKDMISAGRGKEAIEYITDPTNQKAYALRKLQSRIDDDLAKYRKLEKLIYSNQNLTSEEMRLQLNKLDELRTKYLQSLRLPKLRAFAEISPVFDSSVLKILR